MGANYSSAAALSNALSFIDGLHLYETWCCAIGRHKIAGCGLSASALYSERISLPQRGFRVPSASGHRWPHCVENWSCWCISSLLLVVAAQVSHLPQTSAAPNTRNTHDMWHLIAARDRPACENNGEHVLKRLLQRWRSGGGAEVHGKNEFANGVWTPNTDARNAKQLSGIRSRTAWAMASEVFLRRSDEEILPGARVASVGVRRRWTASPQSRSTPNTSQRSRSTMPLRKHAQHRC